MRVPWAEGGGEKEGGDWGADEGARGEGERDISSSRPLESPIMPTSPPVVHKRLSESRPESLLPGPPEPMKSSTALLPCWSLRRPAWSVSCERVNSRRFRQSRMTGLLVCPPFCSCPPPLQPAPMLWWLPCVFERVIFFASSSGQMVRTL